ncbi:MAG: alpha/beta hydrolase [Acidaminococcus sp.]|jgi:fermentation-respiration switch protein FrsA (DUF1100 family)|nr:alpha/beta hydrolase [Acidaminococcus sp.]MCI2099508.1 alpha/beta hydrolase [Acidaminococcus sp.]MCI2113869.1 alpha/beta hydrolase [Acidaminococcus sp.]MCI2115558.1 alpha/beta hydrolase [Acidaminococcus sp.]
MKKFFAFLLVLALLLGAGAAGAIYYFGSPYVDYALKRGNSEDPMAPPAAFEDVYQYANKYPYAQPDPPDVERAEWTMTSFDGLKLSATHFVPENAGSHRWAILVHGYGCNQRFMWSMARRYLQRGYHVLTPDMRASGRSEGQYLTMGALEGKDVARWARAIAEEDPSAKIVLYGVSMGGADVMMALGEGLPKQVKAVVEDSGYSDLKELLTYRMDDLHVPYRDFILLAANLLMKVRTGVFLSDVSPIRAVAQSSVPVLFIHGTNDGLIPVTMMQELGASSAAERKEVVPVRGMGHAESVSLGQQYYAVIFDFVERQFSES